MAHDIKMTFDPGCFPDGNRFLLNRSTAKKAILGDPRNKFLSSELKEKENDGGRWSGKGMKNGKKEKEKSF